MNLIRKIQQSFATKLSFYVLLFVILIFLITFWFFYFFTGRTIREAAEDKAVSLLEITKLKIEDVFTATKTVPQNILWAVVEKGIESDSLYPLTRQIIENNPYISGAAVAFEPYHFKDKGYYFSPYSFRDGDKIGTMQLGNAAYDYFSMDWYATPKRLNAGYWSDPYYDAGGGQMLMVTYSIPIHQADGTFIGIQTVDISLGWLSDLVNSVKPYPSAYTILLGRDGTYIVHPNKEMILAQTIFSTAQEIGNQNLEQVGNCMIKGEAGMVEVNMSCEDRGAFYIFYSPLESIDWSLGMVIRKSEVFAELNVINKIVIGITLGGLALLFLFCMVIIRKLAKPLKNFSLSAREIAQGNFNVQLPDIHSRDEMKELHSSFTFMQEHLTHYIEQLQTTTATKERMESELRIARSIQMGMIPKIFPPFPERDDVDIYASLRPAKEVGGDLYDFFIDGNQLYFIIGDVSGKGIPASLFMAVTRGLYRSATSFLDDPAQILSSMNNAIVGMNESNMFITLFVGILNLEDGTLRYCNAGHNPPLILSPDETVTFMTVHPNIPAGSFVDFKYISQQMQIEKGSTLFLYTDGLTEAENSTNQQYGEKQLLEALKNVGNGTPKDITETVIKKVEAHVNGAEQSDDLTILTIRYVSMLKQLILENNVSQISLLTEFVEAIGEELSLPSLLITNLNLALEETVANIILYAYPSNVSQNIIIEAQKTNNMLVFTITDAGVAFDPTKVKEADITLSAAERPIGGLGIFLIKKIMDEINYQRMDETNVLTLKKKIN